MLKEILDAWLEGYQDSAEEAPVEMLTGLLVDREVVDDIRRKL